MSVRQVLKMLVLRGYILQYIQECGVVQYGVLHC